MPQFGDEFTVEILADGTVKVTTDEISPASHLSAEQFVEFLAQKLGGERDSVKKHKTHQHVHGEHKHRF